MRAVMEMYKEVEASVKLESERPEWFPVKVGVHQGSVLSVLCAQCSML